MALESHQFSPPDADRSTILENYSLQLCRRDEALDRRENMLKKREKELKQSIQRGKEQERELELLRTSMYEERALFQRTHSKRKEELEDAEGKQKAVNDDINGRVAKVTDLLQTSKKTAAELREKREELRRVNENIAHMHTTLRTAQETVDDLRKKSEQAEVRERKCVQIVMSLDRRQTELDELQTKLSALQEDVAHREQSVTQRVSEVQEVMPLKRILPGLRQVARDYCEFRQRLMREGDGAAGSTPVEEPQDSDEEARYLLSFFQDIRAHARALESRESSCAKQEDSLSEKERNLTNLEAALLARESVLKESERKLSLRAKEIDTQSKEAKLLAERAEETSKRVMIQEERLDARESTCKESEVLLKEKEAHFSRQRRLLVAQERSLKRAGEAVKSHEAAIMGEAIKFEELKLRLEGLDEDLRSREALMKTKEIEFSLREARLQQHNNRIRETRMTDSLKDSSELDDEGSGNSKVSQVAASSSERIIDFSEPAITKNVSRRDRPRPTGVHDNSRVEDTLQEAEKTENDDHKESRKVVKSTRARAPRSTAVTETSVPADNQPTNVLPGTVRKQLTFGFTPSGLEPQRPSDQMQIPFNPPLAGATTEEGNSEESSEAAAEQLHGELKAARALWIEKVKRLDTVVASMSVDLTTTGTQLLPVIRNVRSELKRIRDEALREPEAKRSPASAAFVKERERHRQWAKTLSTQLSTIKEVQAGLLHAFNRVLPNSSPGNVFFEPEVSVAKPSRHLPLQSLQLQESDTSSTKSNSGGESKDVATTEQLLKALTPVKTKRKSRKGSRRNESSGSEASVTESSRQPRFRVAIPSWNEYQPIPRIQPTLPSASEELAALLRELVPEPAN